MSSAAFSLKTPIANSPLFIPSDLLASGNSIVNIKVNKLKHYHNHPFKLYHGERLDDMVDSIKANGVLVPLLVRPHANGYYEILAGHNRLEGSKLAGLQELPCIIKENLSDEDAHLIVTESNLIQRSFADLSHSERAESLTNHYNAIKSQGKRTDLIRQVEVLLSGDLSVDTENATSTHQGNKSIETTGAKYGLSKNSVARYIRINHLIPGFKSLLDTEELPIRAGVSLSFISEQRQQLIFDQFTIFGDGTSISMKKADKLRKLDIEVNPNTDPSNEVFLHGCADILVGKVPTSKQATPNKLINIKLKRTAISSYFTEDDTEESIQETVLTALAFYYQHKN